MDYRKSSRSQSPAIIEDRSHRGGHIKKYRLVAHLGKGGFAKVFRVQSLDSNKIYACKVIVKAKLVNSEHRRKLISEIKLHSSLKHENIVKFERHFEDKKNVYILLECIANKSLMELSIQRGKLTEHEVRYFLFQLLTGIKYLHGLGIIHRDLKLGNILLDQHLNLKICDFGLAAKLEYDTDRKTTICGTPNYTAPEILNQRKSGEGHSYEVDIWSVGVIMFTLLTGKPPFETKNIKETYRRIKKIKYEFPIDSHKYMTNFAKGLISQIFTKDPTKRPNLDQINNHPFFKNIPIPKSLPSLILKRAPKIEELFDDPQRVKSAMEQAPNECNDHAPRAPAARRPPLISTGFENKQMHNFNYPKYNHSNANKQYSKTENTNSATTECKNDMMSTQKPLQSQQNMTQKNKKHGAEQMAKKDDFISILKHVDYTKKYGIGYILSNGWTGIYFNDSTKILLHKNKENVIYFDNTDNETECKMSNYPNCLRKKVTLLKHFTAYLWKIEDDNKMDEDIRMKLNRLKQETKTQNMSDNANNNNTVYVKNTWIDQYCILFKLSNDMVQVNFTDSSRIIIMDPFVFYKDKIGNEEILKLDQLSAGNKNDLKKRCRYTQQLLTKLPQKK